MTVREVGDGREVECTAEIAQANVISFSLLLHLLTSGQHSAEKRFVCV